MFAHNTSAANESPFWSFHASLGLWALQMRTRKAFHGVPGWGRGAGPLDTVYVDRLLHPFLLAFGTSSGDAGGGIVKDVRAGISRRFLLAFVWDTWNREGNRQLHEISLPTLHLFVLL